MYHESRLRLKESDSTKCLLSRLQHLTTEVPERHTPFDTTAYNFFGFTNEKPPVQEKKLDKNKFINLMTVEEIDEIEATKTKITAVLNELKSMQEEAFEKQKEVTKRCYDLFSKYQGPYELLDGVRDNWFILNTVCTKTHTDRKKENTIPHDWIAKMKLERKTEAQKKEWEDYVDANWDTAYATAFGVMSFQNFIAKEIPKMMSLDLNSSTASIVDQTWSALYDETDYFQKKTTMYHISMNGQYWFFVGTRPMDLEYAKIANGWRMPENLRSDGGDGLANVKSIEIVNAFYEKTQELLDLIKNLYDLREPGWLQRWNGKVYWVNDKKHVETDKQPNYKVPRKVEPYIND